MRVGIAGIGVAAPGIPDWSAARTILAGERPFEPAPMEYKPPLSLSGAERRRSPASVRLALYVAEQAQSMAGIPGHELAAVFASMTGDGPVITRCLENLSQTPRHVSPTDFHNSVHNAAVGYWAIGAGSHRAATSLSASTETLSAGLLKAALEVNATGTAVLLCVYDIPHLPPLLEAVPVTAPFGCALVLVPPERTPTVMTATVEIVGHKLEPARPRGGFWQGLYDGNPAARVIPILERLAMPSLDAAGALCVGRIGAGALVMELQP